MAHHKETISKKNRVVVAPTGLLVAVCCSPPLTSGNRTMGRLAKAMDILEYQEIVVTNIFNTPTRSTSDISRLGEESAPWINSRSDLALQIAKADGIILAYGTTQPIGPARHHWRNQVEWLHALIGSLNIPVWGLNGQTGHPSRWQRVTHREYPELAFPEALSQMLKEKSKIPISLHGGLILNK